MISWPLAEWGGPVCGASGVRWTEHKQSKGLKNRMLKNMNTSGTWLLRIEGGRNFQSGEDLTQLYFSRLRSLRTAAL